MERGLGVYRAIEAAPFVALRILGVPCGVSPVLSRSELMFGHHKGFETPPFNPVEWI